MNLDCKKITIGTLTFDPQEPVSNLHLSVLYKCIFIGELFLGQIITSEDNN